MKIGRIETHVCHAHIRNWVVSLHQGLDGFLSVEKALLHWQGVFPKRIIRSPVGYTLDPETESEVLRLFDLLCELCGREVRS